MATDSAVNYYLNEFLFSICSIFCYPAQEKDDWLVATYTLIITLISEINKTSVVCVGSSKCRHQMFKLHVTVLLKCKTKIFCYVFTCSSPKGLTCILRNSNSWLVQKHVNVTLSASYQQFVSSLFNIQKLQMTNSGAAPRHWVQTCVQIAGIEKLDDGCRNTSVFLKSCQRTP